MNALTYKYFGVGTFSGNLGQGQTSRSWDQGQGHASITKYTFADGLPSIKRQYCNIMDGLASEKVLLQPLIRSSGTAETARPADVHVGGALHSPSL